MTENKRTVVDEDRQPSDWIEILNTGSQAADLKGWHLTDDPQDLDKWTFPETVLKAGEYGLVFASGKNRAQPGRELHTNFKLDVDGEYLALVAPDGKTILQQFKPRLPSLRPDVSYGVPVTEETFRLLAADSPKWVRIPSGDAPGMEWIQPEASMAGWSIGKGGIGYDTGTNLIRWVGADVGSLMRGKSTAAFLRAPFRVDEPGPDRLVLRMYYNDGFVAWLNGREVVRRNAPEKADGRSRAIKSRGGASPVAWAESFQAEEPDLFLMNGDPGGRARITSSNPDTNRFLRLVNGRLPDQINGVAFPQVITEAARSVSLGFEYRIKGGSGGANDFYLALVPARDVGPKGAGIDLSRFRNGRELDLKDTLAVRLAVSTSPVDANVSLHWNGQVIREARVADNSLAWRFFHRASLQVEWTDAGAVVSFRVTTDSRGGTGREVVLFDKVPVPGVKPYASRLQCVVHSQSPLVTADLDQMAGLWTPAADSLAEDFDISGFRSLLRPGTNVLAVLGLSEKVDDTDFLILPEVYGFATRLQPGNLRYFSPATPLTANQDPGVAAVASRPTLSPKGLVYKGSQAVQMSTTVPAGVIRYTLDGREPSETSPVYSAPLKLEGSAVVKARVFAPGHLPSSSSMESFTLAGGEVDAFSSNLPILLLTAQGSGRSSNRRTPLVARLIEPPKGGRATLKSAPTLEARGDFNLRGYSSTRYPKRSYTLRFRDEYGDKLKAGVAGMPKDSDWVLLGPYPDKTLMRDVLAYELFRSMGHYAPRSRFIEVFLNRDGDTLSNNDYIGVYVLIEKIKRAKSRVDVQELGPADNQEPAITGGYIFKRDHSNDESPAFMSRGGEFFLVEPDPQSITPQQKEWIEKHYRELERSIFGRNFMDPARGYRNYLDVPSFIDQHWLIEMSKNIDGFRYSVIFSKDRGGKVKLEPPWDWNLSFGNANYLGGDSTRGWYTDELRDSEISWFRRLVEDPEFNQQQIDRWTELRRGPLSTEAVLRRVDEMAAQLQEAQERNFRRWNILGMYIHPNAYAGGSYEEEIRLMKAWIKDRMQWIDGQLPPAPSFAVKKDPAGGSAVTIRGKGGSVYYTLDGTDPRRAGGEVSPGAKAYEAALTLAPGSKLVARVKRSDGWSGIGVFDTAK